MNRSLGSLEELECRRLMAGQPFEPPMAAAEVQPAAIAWNPAAPATPGLTLAGPASGSLGTMLEDGSLVITRARLLAVARSSVPAAVDVQNLAVTRGSGTLTPGPGSWVFRPAANWFGQVVFSYTIVTRSPGGERTIDGLSLSDDIANSLNGSARFTPLGLLLTDAQPNQIGSAFLAAKLDLTRDFSTSFRLNLEGGAGGDGVAFVIHDDPRGVAALGGVGGGMGYYGVRKSIGVEFDTYVGAHAADTKVGADHVGILIDGTEAGQWQAFPGFDLRSGPVHAWVDYSARTTTLKVYVSRFDAKPDQPVFTVGRNLAASIGRDAFIGFSAATGAATDRQAVTAWAVQGRLSGTTAVPGRATLAVRPVNDAPLVSGSMSLPFVASGQAVRITAQQLLANATDVDGDVLTLRNLRVSPGARLTANGDGSWTFAATVRQSTVFTLSYEVSDGRLATRASASIAVAAVSVLPGPGSSASSLPSPFSTSQRIFTSLVAEMPTASRASGNSPTPGTRGSRG